MTRTNAIDRLMRWIYMPAVLIAVFTGFGNMPLYKRYYIADLPGMRWSGDFYLNMMVHYIAGALVLMTAVYFTIGFLTGPRGKKLTRTGKIRTVLLALALLSGGLMALKNLPGINFRQTLLMSSDFLHFGAAMFFVMISIVCIVLRNRWTARSTL